MNGRLFVIFTDNFFISYRWASYYGFSWLFHMKFILTLSFSARNPTCNPTWSITHIAFIYIIRLLWQHGNLLPHRPVRFKLLKSCGESLGNPHPGPLLWSLGLWLVRRFLSLTPYALGYITLALAALMSHSTKAHLSPLSQVSSLRLWLPVAHTSLRSVFAPPPNNKSNILHIVNFQLITFYTQLV